MKIFRIIFLFPLALIRLLFALFMSGYVVTFGFIWMKLFGFSKRLQHWVMQTWGKSILFVLEIKVNREEIPKLKKYILMPNHRSYIDIFIIAALSPSAMVAKAEIKKWPFAHLGVKITNSILVDRSEMKSLLNTMQQIKASLDKGIPVTLFPEGTSYKGPLTKSFKNGSFKIAADNNIPVIPMAIHYRDVDDAWVGNDTLLAHFFRQMGKPVTRVYIKYGTPVSDTDYLKIQQQTRKQIDSMLQQIIDSTKS